MAMTSPTGNSAENRTVSKKSTTCPAQQGFTLLELLVVIGIISLLMGMGAAGYMGMRRNLQGEGALSERERALMGDILRKLIGDVEKAVRRELAERLAERGDAPRSLVIALANDEFEVAHPLLLKSTVLYDVDLIEINAITDKVARTSALISGDIDMMMSLDPKAIKQIESADGVRVWSGSTGAYMGICCMLNQAPGNNRDFVLVMKYIQRRKKIVRSILKGQGSVGNDQPINSAYGIDYCSDLPIREHDLDKAKFHLKKSGITEAELHVAEVDTGITDVCLLAQREAQKIGLDLKIKKVPNDGYWGAVWMKSPMNVTGWNMRPSANAMLTIAFAPDAPWNDTLWKDKRMGKWLKEARAAKDPAKRLELYCSMEKLINEDCGMIIMSHKNFVDAMSDKIRGITKMPLGNFGGYEWPEFVWRTDA